MHDSLLRGRRAAEDRNWREAYEALAEADRAASLDADDLYRLGVAAYMAGEEDTTAEVLGRAHERYLADGDAHAAIRAAFYAGISLALRGEVARAGGWLGRAQRTLEEVDSDCAERGYLRLPAVIQSREGGDHQQAMALAAEAAEWGERFGDADLVALARHEEGRASLMTGDVAGGLRLLDETMVTVTGDDLSPMVTGIVYCSVIAGCQETFAWRRAAEWTMALSDWCAGQPGLVAFTGQCLSHRAEVFQHRGEWSDALAEAERSCDRFDDAVNQTPAGRGHYRRGEIHRLRGEFDRAEEAYREASRFGWHPQPGLALLRLGQGDVEAADAAIRRALGETTDPLRRAHLLPGFVEVMVASGDLDEAEAGAAELGALAERRRLDMLQAMAAEARGRIELARGNHTAALTSLRLAWTSWTDLGAPFESARCRTLIGMGCREVGDDDGARLEWEAARETFSRLGAMPSETRVRAFLGGSAHDGGLSDRELEVLALVASGKANKEIARELSLSVRTIDRHLSNIYTKLGVSSRTAAAAYAFRHDLA